MKRYIENKDKLSPLTIQLIKEIKKPGRESLYDFNHRNFKNNLTRNKIWENIGKTLKVRAVELQKLWKYLKRKYLTIIEHKITDLTRKLTQLDMNLIKEMDFFKKFFFQDDEKLTNLNITYEHIKNERSKVKEAATFSSAELKTKELQLIEEMKKAGMEPLYDYTNFNYKNNMFKNILWQELGAIINISGAEAQKIWKNIKRKYFSTIKTETNSNTIELNSQDKELMQKMSYFRMFFVRYKNTGTNLDLDETNAEDIFKNIELDQSKLIEFELIEEVKKPGREFLYDPLNPKFANNITRNKIWEKIAESLNLQLPAVQKLWKNVKRKYYYRMDKEKNGIGIPKKLKPEEMLFMMKMSFFKKYFIASEQNSMQKMTEIINNDKDYHDNFSSDMYEFCDTSNNSELDTKNPLTSESDIDENKSGSEYEIIEVHNDLAEEDAQDQQQEYYSPKSKKQKFIESATKAIENINVTHDAIIENIIAPSVSSSSKKTVTSAFVCYLEAVLDTKAPKVQNKIISEINEILKSY